MKTTSAMVPTAPGRLESRELPRPEIDNDTALLRVEASSISGSE